MTRTRAQTTSDHTHAAAGQGQQGVAVPAGVLLMLILAVLALPGLAARYWADGHLSLVYSILCVFFAVNLLICWWEVCLYFRRDYIEKRARYWRQRRNETGRSPVLAFVLSRVPLKRAFSLTVWANVWAAYAEYDDSYMDRRSYGFNVDVANGFATPLPTLALYAAYAFEFIPALAAGILGTVLFWQWLYMTSAYFLSFAVAKRYARLSGREICIYILAMNSGWILCPILGLFVSIDLIVSGSYSALGY
ncbi:MAG: hypothetical protein OXE48_10310 [Gammaproteobacteria bacterium]|nr:hypothetical protein [Gammaproteobacteria bacterium]